MKWWTAVLRFADGTKHELAVSGEPPLYLMAYRHVVGVGRRDIRFALQGPLENGKADYSETPQ